MKKLGALFAAFAALGLAACGGGSAKDETGSIELRISGPNGASTSSAAVGALKQASSNIGTQESASTASQIKTVFAWVEAASANCNETAVGGIYMAYFSPVSFPITDSTSFKGINAGCTVQITAEAQDASGVALYRTSTLVTVAARQMVGVNLIMQQVVAPGSVEVVAPKISALTMSSTAPQIGVPVALSATVSPSPEARYQWTVTCAGDPATGAFSHPNALTTNLTLNYCETNATVTFSVTDDKIVGANGAITSTVSFVLPYVRQGVAATISINSWPTIDSIRATTNAAPVASGNVDLVAAVNDPDGDAFDLVWSDDCGGSFSGQGTLTPVWTAPAVPGKVCVLKLDVTEKDTNAEGHTDGFNSATFTLQVAPALLTAQPYTAVCDKGTWACAVGSYSGLSATIDSSGLHLSKPADTVANAFSASAHVLGVAGIAFSSASFDTVDLVAGGSPRFYAVFAGGGSCTLDYPTKVGTTYTFTLANPGGGTPCTQTGPLRSLDIIADMMGAAGSVTLTNINVNGIPVVTP